MNTPKYGGGSRNALSPSPHRTTPKGRYFSAEEVNKLIKANFQPKIQFLTQQLQQRQQVIAHLNNKLNQNDQKLRQQASLIESFTKKNRDNSQLQAYIVGTINQLINDKTKQCWQTINAQLRQIGGKMKEQFDPRKSEALVQQQLQKLKMGVEQFIDTHKKKSNHYWLKIKQALGKINAKIVATEKDIMDINVKIQTFQHERTRDRQTILELQNSKNVVKNMIQLKRSVENIYQNYQSVLNLQKNLKSQLEEQHGDSLWHQQQFFRSNSKLFGGQDLVALEYSKEEPLPYSEKQLFGSWKPYENVTQPIVSPIRNNRNNDKSTSDIFQLQKTTPMKGNEPSQLFSLNTSNQMNSKIYNSTFLLNHSMETRKQMCNEIRERLLQLIQIKSLSKPLFVKLDEQINCLKTAQGNYLFDTKGNMFKLKLPDLQKLQEQGILTRNKPKKTMLSNSNVRKSNL